MSCPRWSRLVVELYLTGDIGNWFQPRATNNDQWGIGEFGNKKLVMQGVMWMQQLRQGYIASSS